MYSWALVTGDTPTTLNSRSLREALASFATGVCLVTTRSLDGKREGLTINSFSSVSLTPPLVLWSIRDDTRSADAFLAGRSFVLSVLAESQRELAMHFARPAADKFAGREDDFEEGIGGCPRLRSSVATFECTTYSRYQEGDHTILLGRVEAFAKSDMQPLVFYLGQMGSLAELAQR